MIRTADLLCQVGVTAAAEPQHGTAKAFEKLVMSVPRPGASGFKERVIDGVHFGFARYASSDAENPLDCVFALRVPISATTNAVYLCAYDAEHDVVEMEVPATTQPKHKHKQQATTASELLHALVKVVLADVGRRHNRAVHGAAEPQPIQGLEWRWVSFSVPDASLTLMRRIRIVAAQKRMVPIFRGRAQPAPMSSPVESFLLLFRSTAEFARNAKYMYALAKKLGADTELLAALDPQRMLQQHVPTVRVTPGSDVWKFLVRYGFQTDTAQAATEPPRRPTGVVDALGALMTTFEHGKRLQPIKGHGVDAKADDLNLLVLSALSPDQRTLYSLQAYEVYDVPTPGVEVEVYTENGKSVRHRMPEHMTPAQLLRKMLQLLADRVPDHVQAAAEPVPGWRCGPDTVFEYLDGAADQLRVKTVDGVAGLLCYEHDQADGTAEIEVNVNTHDGGNGNWSIGCAFINFKFDTDAGVVHLHAPAVKGVTQGLKKTYPYSVGLAPATLMRAVLRDLHAINFLENVIKANT